MKGRASESHLPADERRGAWPSPGCRVLRDGEPVLIGRPLDIPAPYWRCVRARARREVRTMAAELVVVLPLAALASVGWVVYLATH